MKTIDTTIGKIPEIQHLFVKLIADNGNGIKGDMNILKDSTESKDDKIIFMYPNEYGGFSRGSISKDHVLFIDGKTLKELNF